MPAQKSSVQKSMRKPKMPINMKALRDQGKIYGAKSVADSCVTLQESLDIVPNPSNHAYFLDSMKDGLICLDIEPKCPAEIKEHLLTLPFIYGEISLSGKGCHLFFPLPDNYSDYPDAMKKVALKHEQGFYEILMCHWVTFTRNMIPTPQTFNQQDRNNLSAFYASLASQAVKSIKADSLNLNPDNIDLSKIPGSDVMIDYLKNLTYPKNPEDFGGDQSRYEYGYMAFLYGEMMNFSRIAMIQNAMEDAGREVKEPAFLCDYEADEEAVMLYKALLEHVEQGKLPKRDKHYEYRYDMPWLLYYASKYVQEARAKRK